MLPGWRLLKFSFSEPNMGTQWTHTVCGTPGSEGDCSLVMHHTQLMVIQGSVVQQSVDLLSEQPAKRGFVNGAVFILAMGLPDRTCRLRFKFSSIDDCQDFAARLLPLVPIMRHSHYTKRHAEYALLPEEYQMALKHQKLEHPPPSQLLQRSSDLEDRDLEEYIRASLLDPGFVQSFLTMITDIMEGPVEAGGSK